MPSAQPLDELRRVLAVRGPAPARRARSPALPRHHRYAPRRRMPVGRHVAGVAEPARRSRARARPRPPTMIGSSPTGRGYSSSPASRVAGSAFVPGRPERAHDRQAPFEVGDALAPRAEGDAEGEVLAFPPAGADAAERPSAAERVERRRGLGQPPRDVQRQRADQRAELAVASAAPASRPSVTHGSGIGSHARPDLRDLDEVVHQRDAVEAGLSAAVSATEVSQPAGSASPHGKRDTCSTNRSRRTAARPPASPRPVRPRQRRRTRHGTTRVPPLVAPSRRQRSSPGAVARPARPPARAGRAAGCAAGTRRRRLSKSTTTAGRPARAREVEPAAPSRDVRAERVDHRRQPRAAPARRRSARASANASVAGVEILLAATDDRPQVVRRHDLAAAGTASAAHVDLPDPGRADEHHERTASSAITRAHQLRQADHGERRPIPRRTRSAATPPRSTPGRSARERGADRPGRPLGDGQPRRSAPPRTSRTASCSSDSAAAITASHHGAPHRQSTDRERGVGDPVGDLVGDGARDGCTLCAMTGDRAVQRVAEHGEQDQDERDPRLRRLRAAARRPRTTRRAR